MADEKSTKFSVTPKLHIPRWDKLRRRQTVWELYTGKDGTPGRSMMEIADMLAISSQTVKRDIDAMRLEMGGIARDTGFFEKVAENTLNTLEDLQDLEEKINQEIEYAQVYGLRKGNHLTGMINNLIKNKELQARLLHLLDPKIELVVKAQKANQLQEAILKALVNVAPEVADKVLEEAERIMESDSVDEGEEE